VDGVLPDTGFQAEIKAQLRDERFSGTEAISFDVEVENLSLHTWPACGLKPVRLAYHWLGQDGSVIVFDGERTLLPNDLGPGAVISLECAVGVPHSLGSHVLEFDMVQEYVSWFKDKGSRTFRIGVSIAADLPNFTDYQAVWDSADLTKDHCSIVGPASEQQFNELGTKKLQFLLDLGLTRESAVLDVGCGTGCLTQAMADFLNDGGRYCGTDVAKQAVDFCAGRFRRQNFSFLQNTMITIPIQDGKYDFIVFYSVFTHTFPSETAALLKDARHLLKESGSILADVFFSSRGASGRNDRALVSIAKSEFLTLLHDTALIGRPVMESIWKFGNEVFQRVMFNIKAAVVSDSG
jgi:SAM-dependent methyltransferase